MRHPGNDGMLTRGIRVSTGTIPLPFKRTRGALQLRDVGLRLVSVALCLGFLALAAPAEARRLALVVGNESYRNVAPLKNARSDAKAVAEALEGLGFEVTLKQDLTLNALKSALREFRSRVGGGDEVIFYFSGHGVQFDGTNYLVPIDIVAESEAQVADDAVPLQRVLDDLRDQKARFSLAIVDACRDNPFKGQGRAIGGRGLAPVSAANGQMVLYSAGAGQAALDRLGPNDADPNGVFTRVLIKEIRKPGVPVDRMLKVVRDEVVRLAKGASHEQVPALYDQTIGEFYFRPGSAAVEPARHEDAPLTASAPSAAPIHVQTAGELEQSFWNRIRDSSDPTDFTEYRAQFPKGVHAGEAALMARKLNRAAAPTARPADVPAASTAADQPAAQPSPGSPAGSGGPFPGYITSSLVPGVNMPGTFTLNRDGTFEYRGGDGARLRGILNVANPKSIVGSGTSTLGRKYGIVQTKYPDGTSSAQVQLRGRVAEGFLHGEYTDRYETGIFVFKVGSLD